MQYRSAYLLAVSAHHKNKPEILIINLNQFANNQRQIIKGNHHLEIPYTCTRRVYLVVLVQVQIGRIATLFALKIFYQFCVFLAVIISLLRSPSCHSLKREKYMLFYCGFLTAYYSTRRLLYFINREYMRFFVTNFFFFITSYGHCFKQHLWIYKNSKPS